MGTRPLQRLHGIRQMSFAGLAHHCATHTRHAHSVGAMHMAGVICDRLGLDAETRRLARLAALLHDVGHGPFSHTFEGVLEGLNPGRANVRGFVGGRIVREDGGIVDRLGGARHAVAAALGGPGGRRPLVSSIVSGSLGACKLDCLARDSRALGVECGFDAECMLHALRHDEQKTRLGVSPEGVPALVGYRLARRMFGREFYSHRVRLAADRMFCRAVEAALEEGALERGDFDVESGPFLEFYMGLDDASIVHRIMWHKDSSLSREILRDIRGRRLLKACYHGHAAGVAAGPGGRQAPSPIGALEGAAAEIRGRLGLRDHEVVAHESDLEARLYGNDAFLVLDDRGRPLGDACGDRSPLHESVPAPSYYVFGIASRREEITRMLAERGIKTDLMA